MLNRSWSTELVPAPQRFGFWRDAVYQAIVGADPEMSSPSHNSFHADISVARSADLGLVHFAAAGHAIVRSRLHIRRDDGDPFLISLQTRGESRYAFDGGAIVAKRGDIAVVNSAHPFRVHFPGAVSRTMAIVPRALIRGRAPWLERERIVKLAPRPPYDAMLRHCLSDIGAARCALDAAGVNALVEHIANLLALSRQPAETAQRNGVRDARLAQLQAYIRSHLADPRLSPSHAAAQLGLSTRWIHRLMQATGTTFGDFVRDARLDACRRGLADPKAERRTIAEVAFAHGFGDLSHFHREFKSRFGATPAQIRASAKPASDA
ncbi:MAG: helix-turn-helix domain-containing protein [Alphaproteobacteria bacterium]